MYGICSTWAFAALYDYTIVNYNFFMFRFTVCTNWAVKDKLVFSAESYADTFLSLLKSKPKNIMHAVHVQCSCSTECDHSPNIYFFGRKSKWDCGISLGCGCGHYPPFICHDLCLISVSQAMFVLRALFFVTFFIFFSPPYSERRPYKLLLMRAIGVFFHCGRLKNTPSADQFNEEKNRHAGKVL